MDFGEGGGGPPGPPLALDLSEDFEMTISGEWHFTPNGTLEHKTADLRISQHGTFEMPDRSNSLDSQGITAAINRSNSLDSQGEFRLTAHDILLDSDSGNLGRGAGGYVTSAVHRRFPDRKLAVKVVTIDDPDKRNQLYADLKTLMDVCPASNLVHFFLAYVPRDEIRSVHMVLELMDLGSLADLFLQLGQPRQPFPERHLLNILRQVLTGLDTLHNLHRAHRDIKPANILINTAGEVKLTDFGITKNLGDTQGMCQSFVGTAMYMSPERIEQDDYSRPADVWAIGVILYEMAEGRFPLPDDVSKNVVKLYEALIAQSMPLLSTERHSPEVVDIVTRCLDRTPANRPLVAELLEEPLLCWDGPDQRTAPVEEFQQWLTQTVECAQNQRNSNQQYLDESQTGQSSIQKPLYESEDRPPTTSADDKSRQQSNRSQASIEMI